ncbi:MULTISPECIES: glycosyltransferase family 4 protein [unclassified Streptomyces]|uniref:glycosyltransferase family 4 protein n=1 Tax=unclassified Streptomyces TaxID=2593676 RepID=UPI000BFCE0BD|nr:MULTISPECIES: glycosyltransferase family 4 protein [unclassified Streptomyces]PVC99589.1 glycosyltransferase family 1 protein [Streptomyces sp. CS147]
MTERVLITNHTPIHGSGSGTYILALATGLARRGHDVALLTPPGGTRVALPPGIQHFEAAELAGEFPSFTGHPCSSRLYDGMSPDDLEGVTRTWRRSLEPVVRAWKPTVVHSQHLWLLTSAVLDLGLPVVATCHGSEVPYLDAEAGLRRFRSGKSPDAVISISRWVQRELSRHLPADTPHAAMLNPYDARRFSYGPRPATGRGPRIGFVNRLVEYKRGDRFLEITAALVDLVPDLEARIIGDGTERPALERLSEKLGLTRHTRFLGFQPLASMPDVFRDLDAVVMCSPSEPFGLAAIEAAACGTPVFVPDSGGLGELAAPPHIRSYALDESAVIAEVADVLTNPESESQRQLRSLHIAERYALESYLDQLEDVYSGAIQHRQGGHS